MTLRVEAADISDSALANEPTDRIEPKEPTDPIEKLDPTEPMLMNELREPMQSIEFFEARLQREVSMIQAYECAVYRSGMTSGSRRFRRPPRVHPVADLSARKSFKRALALAAVETLGLAVLFTIYWLLDVRDSLLAPLMFPPVVSFLLVLSTSSAVISRPLRIMAAYIVAGTIGFAVAALPGATFVEAGVAGGLTMLCMHLLGAFHAPATAIPLIVVLTYTAESSALVALPLLILLAALVVFLAWGAHRILGDADYPQAWW